MPNTPERQPTAAEIEVLQILWQHGPLAVKDVHERFAAERDVKYTTTLKTMQVMFERGFLSRESAGRKHIYAAAVAQEATQNSLLDTFLKRTFRGSAKSLAMRALGNYKTTKDDIDELKAMIERLENEQDND